MASGDVRAGRAFIELFLNNSELVAGLSKSLKSLTTFGSAVKDVGENITDIGSKTLGVGIGIVAPLLGAAKVFSDTGDALAKMSERTGASVESLSALKFAAGQSGVTMDVVENSLRKMQKTIVEASQGSKSAKDALASLGVTLADLKGLSPEKQFELVTDRLSSISDPANRAAAAMEIFGKSGTGILPLAGNVAALTEEAERLGVVMSTSDAKAAEALNDAFGRLQSVFQKVVNTVGAALAPVLEDAASRLSLIGSSTARWIAQNGDLVVSLLKVGSSVVVVGGSLFTLGKAIEGVGSTMKALSVIGPASLTFLLSPIGLVIGAIALLTAGVLAAIAAFESMDTGEKAVQSLKEFADREIKANAERKRFEADFARQQVATAKENDAIRRRLSKERREEDKRNAALDVAEGRRFVDLQAGSAEVSVKEKELAIAEGEAAAERDISRTDEDISDEARANAIGLARFKIDKAEELRQFELESILKQKAAAEEAMRSLFHISDPAERGEERARLSQVLNDLEKNRVDLEVKGLDLAIDLVNTKKDEAKLNRDITKAQFKRTEDEAAEFARMQEEMDRQARSIAEEAERQAEAQRTSGQATGSFSGRALAGLGIASNVSERTAKSTEETAKNTREAVRILNEKLVGTYTN